MTLACPWRRYKLHGHVGALKIDICKGNFSHMNAASKEKTANPAATCVLPIGDPFAMKRIKRRNHILGYAVPMIALVLVAGLLALPEELVVV